MNIIKKLQNLDAEEIFRILQFGLPKQKGTIYDIRSANLGNIPSPVFFLSTGRCGTAWFSKLISSDNSIKALHSPTPSLTIQSKLAFKYLYKQKSSDGINELLKEIVLAGREAQLRYSFKTRRRIVETNNGITFFSPILAELFPTAKFVHLIRNPQEFISSGLKREYYSGKNEDLRRIKTDRIFDSWIDTDQIIKIAWLWHVTNDFIYDFGKKYSDRIYRFNFSEDLTTNNVLELMAFLEIDITEKRVEKMIEKPVNVQKGGDDIKYENWSDIQKEQFHKLCDEMIDKLNMN